MPCTLHAPKSTLPTKPLFDLNQLLFENHYGICFVKSSTNKRLGKYTFTKRCRLGPHVFSPRCIEVNAGYLYKLFKELNIKGRRERGGKKEKSKLQCKSNLFFKVLYAFPGALNEIEPGGWNASPF